MILLVFAGLTDALFSRAGKNEAMLPKNSLKSLIEQHGGDTWPLTLF
jgi:hypothetical protein